MHKFTIVGFYPDTEQTWVGYTTSDTDAPDFDLLVPDGAIFLAAFEGHLDAIGANNG